ncbi:hypothetical protein niasHT_018549 [Heterodera trifolii]|uniref:Galectin domain-containing protein n=1 Tax=Heterodera trifolii TaxID=157864 RepID=A0ABD2L549_9BILA
MYGCATNSDGMCRGTRQGIRIPIGAHQNWQFVERFPSAWKKNANFVLIRLWDKKRSLIFAMEMTKNGTKLEPSNELIDCGNTRFMKASHKIKVQIVVQKFLSKANVILFAEPKAKQIVNPRRKMKKRIRNEPKPTLFKLPPNSVRFPFYFLDPLLSVGDSIEINGAIMEEKDFSRFAIMQIYLLHELAQTDTRDSHVPLEISFIFIKPFNGSEMNIRSYSQEICGFGATCSHTEQKSKLFAGEQFTIRISVEQSQFNIDIHGARVASFMPSIKMATWAGNVLGIVGDLKEKPTVKVNRAKINRTAQKRGTQFVLKVPDEDRKARNKTIQILGEIVKPDFTINFLYGALEENPIGINVLKMIFSSFGLNSKLLDKEEKDELTSSIKSGKRLNLTLTIRGRQIKSYLNNIEIFDEQTTLPYWAIQYIQIDGVKAQKGGGKLVTIENEAKSLEGLLTSLIF